VDLDVVVNVYIHLITFKISSARDMHFPFEKCNIVSLITHLDVSSTRHSEKFDTGLHIRSTIHRFLQSNINASSKSTYIKHYV